MKVWVAMKGFPSSRVIAGVLFLSLTACASSAPRVESPNRKIASVAAKFGLECLAEADVFQEVFEAPDSDAAVDPALLEGLTGVSESEKTKVLARQLAESFAYGQSLLENYDQLLDQKYSLERIMQTTSVYAELHALYFLNHDLHDLASKQFAAGLLDRLGRDSRSGFDLGNQIVREYGVARIEEFKQEILARHPNPAYAELSLANLKESVDEVRTVASGCSTRNRAGFSSIAESIGNERVFLEAAASRAIKKGANAYKAFLPRNGERGASIVSLVQDRGAQIQKEWAGLIKDRRPQSTPADGKVIYPDSGKPGNIYGLTFPKGTWALTFDDGPHGGTRTVGSYTRQVLANLKHHNVPATFFILSQHIARKDCDGVGSRIARRYGADGTVISERTVNIKKDRPGAIYPELALAERDQGHAVASHSYYHSEVPKGNDVEQDCEIRQAADVFKEVVGTRPKYFRLPYGSGVSSAKVRTKIAAESMIHVHWSVDTLDWQDRDPDSIVRRTLKAMAIDGRGIILFHDVHPQSVIASEKIMGFLKDPVNLTKAVTIPEIVDQLNGVRSEAATE